MKHHHKTIWIHSHAQLDEYWMFQAWQQAWQAWQRREVPVGAVLVLHDQLISTGYNAAMSLTDPTAHAEILALRQGAASLGTYRLVDTTLYVTLEPCCMCASAMVHARIKRLVFAAYDAKAGAIQKLQFFEQSFLNHRVEYQGGVLAEPCAVLLKQFFLTRRK